MNREPEFGTVAQDSLCWGPRQRLSGHPVDLLPTVRSLSYVDFVGDRAIRREAGNGVIDGPAAGVSSELRGI